MYPILGPFCQWLFSCARVQVDVAAQRPEIRHIFHVKSLKAALVKMPRSLVSLGVPIGISAEPMLHAIGEIGLRGLN
jgi:hypothetical protein